MNKPCGLPRAENSPVVSPADIAGSLFNNDFLLTGDNIDLTGDHIVFLENLVSVSPVDLVDFDGLPIISGVSELNWEYRPSRFDKGLKIKGNVTLVKGFIVKRTNLN